MNNNYTVNAVALIRCEFCDSWQIIFQFLTLNIREVYSLEVFPARWYNEYLRVEQFFFIETGQNLSINYLIHVFFVWSKN